MSSMSTMRSSAGRNAASAFRSVVLPVLVPPLIKMFSSRRDRRLERRQHLRRHRADPHEFLGREEPRLKLADRQRRAAEAARREDGGHARAVRQARVEDRLLLGDVVAQRAGDVLDGDAADCARRAGRPATSRTTPCRSTKTRREPLTMISLTSGSWIRCAIGRRNGRMTSKLITGLPSRRDRSSWSGRRDSTA